MELAQAKRSGRDYVTQSKVNGLLPLTHAHLSIRCDHAHPQGSPYSTAFIVSIDALERLSPKSKDMLTCNPPSKIVRASVFHVKRNWDHTHFVVECETGITFTHMLNHIRRLEGEASRQFTTLLYQMRDVCFMTTKKYETRRDWAMHNLNPDIPAPPHNAPARMPDWPTHFEDTRLQEPLE